MEICQQCLRTLLENNPSDTVIEALRHGEQVIERQSEIETNSALLVLPRPRGDPNLFQRIWGG